MLLRGDLYAVTILMITSTHIASGPTTSDLGRYNVTRRVHTTRRSASSRAVFLVNQTHTDQRYVITCRLRHIPVPTRVMTPGMYWAALIWVWPPWPRLLLRLDWRLNSLRVGRQRGLFYVCWGLGSSHLLFAGGGWRLQNSKGGWGGIFTPTKRGAESF